MSAESIDWDDQEPEVVTIPEVRPRERYVGEWTNPTPEGFEDKTGAVITPTGRTFHNLNSARRTIE